MRFHCSPSLSLSSPARFRACACFRPRPCPACMRVRWWCCSPLLSRACVASVLFYRVLPSGVFLSPCSWLLRSVARGCVHICCVRDIPSRRTFLATEIRSRWGFTGLWLLLPCPYPHRIFIFPPSHTLLLLFIEVGVLRGRHL